MTHQTPDTYPQGGTTLNYWEDLAHAPIRHFGPIVLTSRLLDQLLDLTGERHPVHDDDSFARAASRRQRIVPGGLIHSITSGWAVRHGSPVAIVGMRTLAWDFVRPLYPDTPFYFTAETESSQVIDDRVGIVKTVRRVLDDSGRAFAIGRMNVVVLRRSAEAARVVPE
ncbi:MAG: MaoC family dehydratase [Pseudonocardiaceae bacterium]